jgi:hypothetical protein
MRWVGVGMLAWLVAIGGAIAAVNALLPAEIARGAVGGVILVSVIGYGAFLVFALVPKSVPIDVTPTPGMPGWALVVDGGRGGTFPLAGAVLGPWTVPTYGTAQGTALHLSDGRRRWRLGGRDHRPAAGARLDAPGVQSVDAYMPAAEFEALLALLPAPQAAPDPHATVRCLLVPNRASARGSLSVMLPWLLTMAAVGLLSAVFAALDVFDTPAGQTTAGVLCAVLVVAGLVVTAVRGSRTPQPSVALDLGPHDARVVDLATGRTLAAAPLGHVTATPARHVYGGRMRYAMPVLVVTVPGAPPLTIGIPDLRYSWAGEPRDHGAASYVVGGADWLALVERLGARPFLNVGPG